MVGPPDAARVLGRGQSHPIDAVARWRLDPEPLEHVQRPRDEERGGVPRFV
jgi:hypothetical protein